MPEWDGEVLGDRSSLTICEKMKKNKKSLNKGKYKNLSFEPKQNSPLGDEDSSIRKLDSFGWSLFRGTPRNPQELGPFFTAKKEKN